jgi:hypothetical protein
VDGQAVQKAVSSEADARASVSSMGTCVFSSLTSSGVSKNSASGCDAFRGSAKRLKATVKGTEALGGFFEIAKESLHKFCIHSLID